MSRLRGLNKLWWFKNPEAFIVDSTTQFCRYVSNFNGTSSYAESLTRIIDLDAVDPSFEITMWRDLSQSGTLCSQNVSSSINNREFQIYTNGDLSGVLGGQGKTIMSSAECVANAGFGIIKIRYEHSSTSYFVYKDGLLIKESTGVVIGASREPTAKFKYMARSNGTIDNQAFFATGQNKNISIVHNSLDIFLPMDESVFEGDGSIIYENTNGDSNYNAVGYNINLTQECEQTTGYQISKIVGFGASLINRFFESTTLNNEAKAGYGFSGIEVINEGIEGSDASGYLSRIDDTLAEYVGQAGVVFFVHGFGNNVSNSRPYATATPEEISEFQNAMDGIIYKIQKAGHICIWSGITYRAYTSNFPDESYGSLPFNVNINYPTIQSRIPFAWDSVNSLPVVDLYNLIKDNQDWLDVDGVHLNPEGERHGSNYIYYKLSQLEKLMKKLNPNLPANTLFVDGSPVTVDGEYVTV